MRIADSFRGAGTGFWERFPSIGCTQSLIGSGLVPVSYSLQQSRIHVDQVADKANVLWEYIIAYLTI